MCCKCQIPPYCLLGNTKDLQVVRKCFHLPRDNLMQLLSKSTQINSGLTKTFTKKKSCMKPTLE